MDKRLLLAFIISLFFIGTSYAQTDVSGILTANTTWTKAQSPYVLKDHVTVPFGMSLTIEPGATVVRNNSYRIIVNGAIKASGTNTDSITFKSGYLLDNTSLFFIDFQKTNLNLSKLNCITFKNESASTNNLRLGRETSTSTGSVWNSGSLVISNSNLSKGYTITEGYKGAFSLEIKGCVGNDAYITSPSSDAEQINITNSRFFNSTFNSDLQIGGIQLKKDFFKNCTFLIGCCGTRLSFDSCKVDNSFLLNTPNVGTTASGLVSISNSIMLNTPVTTPKNTYHIKSSKIIADRPLLSITGKALSFMVDVADLTIERSEISSFKDADNGGLKTWSSGFFPQSLNKNLFNGLTNSLNIYNYSEVQINESNFLDTKNYAITNNGAKPLTVTQTYFELKEAQKVVDLFQERIDPLGSIQGTIQSHGVTITPSTTAPIAAPTNVIKTSSGSAVKVSWIKNPAGNVKGYKIYWGYIDGFSYSNSAEVSAGDSTYNIGNIANNETIAVTTLSINADGKNDQISGYESWFSPAGIPTPVIKTFTPRIAGENHKVVIDGYNLDIVSTVSFGGVPVKAITVVSPTRIIATIGNGNTGNVTVNNSFGYYEKEGFTFIPPPSISTVKPVPSTVDLMIGINGSNFSNTKAITVGGIKATWYTVVSDKLITAKVPAGAKSGMVTVTTPYGTGALNGFEYLDAPMISYKTPQFFLVGDAIPVLTPENKGGTIPVSIYGNTTTFVGNGQAASTDGNAGSASFNNPIGIAADEQGNLYVTERSSHRIRMVTPDGNVTTLAGGSQGFSDGVGSAAKFNNPVGIAVGLDGNIYVADQGNNRIRKITRDGVVSTYLGTGVAGSTDGFGSNVTFNQPTGIATSPNGGFYVTEQGSNRVRNIGGFGAVTTFAGNGNAATVNGTGSAVSFNKPVGIAVDGNGNVYVTESAGNVIRKITPSGMATTLAGSSRSGYTSGNGAQAAFSQPYGLTIDKAGTLYVADRSTNTIRIISPKGDVKTLAGSWTGNSGSANGIANNALFSQPTGVALSSGKLYVADLSNKLIRSIDITGYSITPSLPIGLTFNSQTGVISGTPASSLPATDYTVTAANVVGVDSASIRLSIALPQAPNISYNNTTSAAINTPIKPITPYNTGGTVTYTTSTGVFTGAGSGSGFADGNAATARFSGATGLTIDNAGNLYVADANNNRVRKVTTDGTVSTLAGSGSNGSNNGAGSLASFAKPSDVAVDANGNVYVIDASNYKIRKITPAGVVTTYAGNGAASSIDGTSTSSSFRDPRCIAIDGNGIIYVTESSVGCVRKIDQNGTVSTIATGLGVPWGITVDAAGNLFVAESSFNQISKITPSGAKSIFVNGLSADPLLKFTSPKSITIDPAGNLYITDQSSYIVRKVSANGEISALPDFNPAASPATSFFANGITYADGKLYISEDGRIRRITLYGYSIAPALPNGLSIDAATGTVSGLPVSATTNSEYVVTANNPGGMSSAKLNLNVIREFKPIITYDTVNPFELNKTITPLIPKNTGGAIRDVNSVMTVFAGSASGFGYLDGPKADAKFQSPNGIAADNKGNLFVVDKNNNRIRKIATDGTVSTFAGSGASMLTDGIGAGASFNSPYDVVCDKSGNLFVSDLGNYRIRKISPDGQVSTFAGNGAPSSVDGMGTNASFAEPRLMTIDTNDNLYVIDYTSGKIRKITPAGVVTTLASGFNTPRGIAVDASGNVYVSNVSASPIKKIAPNGQISDFVTANASDPLNSISFAYAMTIDPGGNLYVLDSYTYLVKKVSPSGVVSQLPGLNYTPSPSGVIYALNITYNNGKLYFSDYSMIRQITLNGFWVEPQLPAGLNIDKLTGIISGTPTQSSSPKDFSITAVNADGAGSTKLTLTVNGSNGISFAPLLPATYGDPAISINATSTVTSTPITFISNNLDVATVANGKITITGAGSAIITAKQTGVPEVAQTLIVNPKAISITATNLNKIYADADPVLNYTLSNGTMVGSDVLTGILNRDAGENAGIYKINQGTLTASKNYILSYTGASLIINKKDLTVTAEDKSRMPGKNNPELTVIYEGFANGDNSGKLSKQPVVSTTASLTSPSGIYDLVPGNGLADNYVFIYKNGKLTVNIAANNFKVAAVNVSCKGQNNGSINITPSVSASYTAVLTGNSVNRSAAFTSGTTFDNLTPGAYNICITDAALPGRPQCFDVVISEPKDLLVYASTDKASGMLTLALTGGSNYNVTLNGTVYKTSSSSISVPLQSGSNKLTVTTNQPCQGTFEEFYVQTDKQLPYPNPFQEVIYVNLGEDVIGKVAIKLYDVSSGALKLNQQFTAQSGVVRLDAAQLGMGVYSMHLTVDGKEKVYKLIKK